jgi:hypothetical protein
MWMRRLRREILELNDQCARAASDEERASFELTRSARDFSRRTREVADDKLAFSATLVRAGEIEAANRLIADFEVDVRSEEAALAEQVNEVKVVSALRRQKMTRLRLARTLAAATLSAGLLMLSVAGVAVAAFIDDLTDDSGSPGPRSVDAGTAFSALDHPAARPGAMKNIRFADGTTISLRRDQFLALKRLTRSGDVSRAELERLLVELVGPEMAGKLAAVLIAITTQVSGELTIDLGSDPGATKDLDSKAGDEGHKPSTQPPQSGTDEPVNEEPVDDEPDDGGVIDTPLGGGRSGDPDLPLP